MVRDPSPSQVAPDFRVPRREGCEDRCPGCRHRDLTAGESESLKKNWLTKALAPWASRLGEIQAVSGDARLAYRTKTCLRAEYLEGRWAFGLKIWRGHGRERVSELVAIPHCPVHVPWIRSLVERLSRELPGPEILPLVFLVISGKQVTLVLKTRHLPALDLPYGEWGAQSVYLNLNASAGERVFSSRGWVKVFGTGSVVFEDPSTLESWEYGPDSFQQLIPALYGAALREAGNFLSPRSGDSIVDLCCGIGSSARQWVNAGARVAAVELSGDAYNCASRNVPSPLLTLLRGRNSERIPQLQTWAEAAPGRRLLYVNPPRLGLESQVVSWVREGFRPEKIGYLSCSAGTLRKDLEALDDQYRVERITPYDFFPQTHHVETLVLLSARTLGSAPTPG